LPVDNITAERLAEYLCAQLLEALRREQDVSNLTSVTVGVEEAPGQTAFYRRTFE
jgi:6-pyruvoyltetrahydropterin/6-carboxytetrahydropterin synthase